MGAECVCVEYLSVFMAHVHLLGSVLSMCVCALNVSVEYILNVCVEGVCMCVVCLCIKCLSVECKC